MKNRIELAGYFRDKGYTKGAEIGVADGRYSQILMQTIPDLTLLGVDCYRPYDEYNDYRRFSTFQQKLNEAWEKLREYDKYVFILTTSERAAELVPDNSLDFIFIDGNHAYEFVKQDLQLWRPKVRQEGMMSGHDYYHSKRGKVQVVQAVDEFAKEHGFDVQSTQWDKEAHRDDHQPDWYFEV